MLLKEINRWSSQHRTLYCYFILSLWIFLLIAGMYKYMGSNNNRQTFLNTRQYKKFINKDDELSKNNKLYQYDCNPIDNIKRKDDGGIIDGWHLQGVLLLIRHGDRGPMAHVRGINNIDCGNDNSLLLNKYKTFLANTTTGGIPTGHSMWMKTGSFHSFPLLPAYSKSCHLGQLTYKGISQLLHIGEMLRQIYALPLGLLNKPITYQKTITNTSQPMFITDEIVIYSTRYRRTFQSAMAFMFTFLQTERWLTLTLRESHSLAFCFSDCACPQAEYLKNKLSKESQLLLEQHPAISAVVQWIGTSLLQNPSTQLQPMEVRDAVLAILCHNAPLPCRRTWFNDADKMAAAARGSDAAVSTTNDPSDFINIDQDDNNNVNSNNNLLSQQQDKNRAVVVPAEQQNADTETDVDSCLELTHIAALMSYTNWQGKREAKHKYTHQQGFLRAYGLIRNIVNFMLKIVSGDKTKFILYSGHDKTLQFLISALGIYSQPYFIPYATRMAFEVYKSDQNTEYYFRLVYNGVDVTQEIDFCAGGKSLRISKDSRGNKADLCPIENIIRFIHDDYFGPLNASNYKDACTVQKRLEF